MKYELFDKTGLYQNKQNEECSLSVTCCFSNCSSASKNSFKEKKKMVQKLFLCVLFITNVLFATLIFQVNGDLGAVNLNNSYRRSTAQDIEEKIRNKDNAKYKEYKDLIFVSENGTEYQNVNAWYDVDIEKDKNLTKNLLDSRDYYKSFYIENGEQYFIDLSSNELKKRFDQFDVEELSKLSNSYRKAYHTHLKFSFPYYGHTVRNIVITSDGFMNIGSIYYTYAPMVHYVAPLMCDFNLIASNDTKVYIGSNNELFIVQWTDILLRYDNKRKFTFQSQLHKNGTIVMAYKDIPISPIDIKNTSKLNVTVGLSNGFILTFKHIFSFSKKVIIHRYIYSNRRINFPLSKVKSNSAIKLDLLPSCLQFHTCDSCLNATNSTCHWCPALRRCFDSYDRYRQSWLLAKCHDKALDISDKCSTTVPSVTKKNINHSESPVSLITKKRNDDKRPSKGLLIGGLIGVLLLILIICVIAFYVYAYLHPQSRSGMWLIEHRPGRIFQKRFAKVPEEELI